MISYDDFAKLDIRIGTILAAGRIPDTDKLIKLSVDVGEDAPRQIVAGIAFFVPDVSTLVGKEVAVLANLEPRVMRGVESQGMILAASNDDNEFSLLSPAESIKPGSKVR